MLTQSLGYNTNMADDKKTNEQVPQCTHPNCILMTREEFREELSGLVKTTVQESVKETFTLFGIDVAKPIELQRDFQFLRDWRITTASIRGKAIITGVGLIVAGIIAVAWLGIKILISKVP